MESKSFTVLVVDDETLLRESVVRDFKRKGFNVLSAENGEVALRLLDESKIDVVVSDVRMPGGDGLTLLEKLRSRHPAWPPVILVTGYADLSEKELMKKGAYKYISKPFVRKELLSAVLAALEIQFQDVF